MSARLLVYAIVLLSAAAEIAGAQLAATVPVSDPVYAAIDEISASVPVRGIITGQRPWSRREVARIVAALDARIREVEADSTRAPLPPRVLGLVDSLASAYGSEILQASSEQEVPALALQAVRSVRIDALATNSEPRAIPKTNGLGDIDAVTNPIVEPNAGRPVADGATGNVEILSELAVGTHLAFGVQPRFTRLWQRDGSSSWQVDFQRLYARGVLFNIAAEVGADAMLWGQAGDRGMLLSANARPLHAITVSNDTAITLPWLFRFLGPTRAALLIANLGKDQNFPGAQLVSYKLSFTPTPRLELGAALLDQMGGGGSRPCSMGCRLKDLFPYVFWVIRPGSDQLATNKVVEGELRYRLPQLAGTTLFYEMDMDDFDLRRIRSFLWNNTGHVVGARTDRLTPDGRLAAEVQVHHTGLTLYEHYEYTSGLTYRQSVLGDPLGVNGNAAYGSLLWRRSIASTLTFSAAFEERNPSVYEVQTANANQDGWRYVMTQALPHEKRVRATLGLQHVSLGPGADVYPRVSVERVLNNAFVEGSTRTNFLAGITVRARY